MGVLLALPGAGAEAQTPVDIASVPVSFSVKNVNGSGSSCRSDGESYVLRGELVGPRAVLLGGAPATATLYLHEYGFDDFWHFRTVAGVDYATEMARAGHVSVAIDRLGYDDSPRPDGNAICIGAHADMAHQVVSQLRSGTYLPEGIAPRAFQQIVLAGHSVGGAIAELEAYSFRDIAALMLFGHTDGDYSPASLQTGVRQGGACREGGDGGPAPNYAFFGATPEDSRALAYRDADPAVVEAQLAARHRDPCGDVSSLIPALATNRSRVAEIGVPVLLLYGQDDATLAPGAGERQARLYTGSGDVSSAFFENAGHALVLERVAPQVRATVSRFLTERGFGPSPGSGAPRPQPAPADTAPVPRIRGVKSGGCTRRSFRVRIRIAVRPGALRLARLRLDGRRVAETRRRSISRVVGLSRLRPGRHRLTVSARDTAGNTGRATATFRRCG